ncbi:MAG: hypothetical protein WAV67_08225 [Dokdonella sp.]
MTNDRKKPDKRAAAKISRTPKGKPAAKKRAGDKAASRQTAGIVAGIGAAKKTSKKTVPANKLAKPTKQKAVRDDFKMPAGDYALIEALKQRALEFNRPTKKNELLRAGLQALGALDNMQLQQRLLALEPTKRKAEVAKGSKAKR